MGEDNNVKRAKFSENESMKWKERVRKDERRKKNDGIKLKGGLKE